MEPSANAVDETRTPWAVALVVAAVAFAVRAYWVLRVQSPLDAIYSDMFGYVNRAELLLAGETLGEPRLLTLWPWGTHALVAAEFALFGRHAATAIGICHAAVAAVIAPCAAAITQRLVRHKHAALTAGLATALWHPHIVYTGFFSSELWFCSAMMLATICFIRHGEGRSGALGAGLFLAIAFVVRPQILLTALLVGLAVAAAHLLRAPLLPNRRFASLSLLVPICIAIAVSSTRYYYLSGDIGLIAANGPVMRLFADTDIARIESSWTNQNGEWRWAFAPPSKETPTAAAQVATFNGYVADPEILDRIRRDHLRGVSIGSRLVRMANNIALLAIGNDLWPESNYKQPLWRNHLRQWFSLAVLGALGLAAAGLWYCRRGGLAAILLAAHVATILFVAARYFGEARYRVPYDPIFLVLATLGAWNIAARLAKGRTSARPHDITPRVEPVE
jgi:hypothetical protein